MGHIAEFGSKRVRKFVKAIYDRPDPKKEAHGFLSMEIKPGGYQEYWATGTTVYHNPHALVPLEMELLPGAKHITLNDGQLETTVFETSVPHPYWMLTESFTEK